MHLAEFTEDEERLVITASNLREAIDTQAPKIYGGEKVAFFDFAAGRDENVFYMRKGNIVELVDAWTDTDTVQAVRKFMRLAKQQGLAGSQCWGDADGLGKPMVDLFADEGFPINAFHGGLPAKDSQNYANLISEVWIQGARKIERGKIHMVSNNGEGIDPATFKQITSRFIEWDDRGKLRVESKKKMAARGLRSPDRGDALLGCIICGSSMTGSLTDDVLNRSESGSSRFSVNHVSF
jgi:phage terminase large subunit